MVEKVKDSGRWALLRENHGKGPNPRESLRQERAQLFQKPGLELHSHGSWQGGDGETEVWEAFQGLAQGQSA
jgi:hypothetical protein